MTVYTNPRGVDSPMLGVPGKWTHKLKPSGDRALWYRQHFDTAVRNIDYYDEDASIALTLRFDDDPENKHNTFSVVGDIWKRGYLRTSDLGNLRCGSIHDDAAKYFPELAGLIKWHLTSSDGPMHYIANTLYHAGDRDHHGKRAGEPWAWDRAVRFAGNPIVHKLRDSFAKFLEARYQTGEFHVVAIAHDVKHGEPVYGTKFSPKWTFVGYGTRWHECPFDSQDEAQAFADAMRTCGPIFVVVPTLWSEGKKRELDHARTSAVWPEASDAFLMQEPDVLRAALEARHPALMAAFRRDMDGAGFYWSPDDLVRVAAEMGKASS